MSIDFNIDQALDKLAQLVQSHGQQAVAAASAVVQVNAIDTLLGTPVWGLCAAFCWWGFRRSLQKLYNGGDELGWGTAVIASALVGLPFTIMALSSLFNVWSWVALFNPHLALAHLVLQKLGAP